MSALLVWFYPVAAIARTCLHHSVRSMLVFVVVLLLFFIIVFCFCFVIVFVIGLLLFIPIYTVLLDL